MNVQMDLFLAYSEGRGHSDLRVLGFCARVR